MQVIKLITRNTIEKKIDSLIWRKAELAADLIRPDDPSLVTPFTREELVDLPGRVKRSAVIGITCGFLPGVLISLLT